MNVLKKYGFHFLMIGVISDFLTPYVLGIFYPELHQMTAVMSLFGDVGSPVRGAFLIWSVVAGCFYTLSLPAIYTTFKETSRPLAGLTAAAIGTYGIGDCIFTGLFSVDTADAQWNFSTWVHNIGSGIGYVGFLLFPLFLYLIYKKQNKRELSRRYFVLLFLSLTVAAIYGLARIPQLNQLVIFKQLGFWQRLSFVFNYLPIVALTMGEIKKRSHYS
ncbi:DUF998 domain-containing protein [Enterococcus malodoratus]|uniref:DUF998 domain-containing protein n=1 Tax=Enterococcus malodoratus TaxID=71451 RepID=UPI002073853E|nr:DUF998 domain-containing protein [Enterococcus malodoratus]